MPSLMRWANCETSQPAPSASTSTENAANTIFRPALKRSANYPDIKVEIVVDYGLTDIAAERYDAGIRPGGNVAKGMIAVRMTRTCAWRSSVRLPILSGGHPRERHKT